MSAALLPRKRRKEDRPNELLEAALDLFVEKGFAATRLEDIATRAGVSKGTLYLYFAGKEALFKAVIQDGLIPALAELEARLTALIRRARGSEHPRFACGALSYDAATKQFTLAHELLTLTPREHAALRALIQCSGEPLSKQEIAERVFSDEQDVQPEAVEVLVHRLRKRLANASVRITTLRGLGYVLESGA